MRFDTCASSNRATGPSVLPAPVPKRRVVLSLPPLSIPQLPSTATSATTITTTRSRDKYDAALRCSITALDKDLPFSDERTPAANNTAFQRSHRLQRSSRPILFMLYLLALLLEMPGRHWAMASTEGTSSSSTKSIDNSERGLAEEKHPYNEYTWELNQLNPWLSACDLAGPAPADLQGSCGPPEVPKNCPTSCTVFQGQKKSNLSLFDDVIKSLGYIGNATAVRWEKQLKRQRNTGSQRATIAPEQCLFYLEESHKRDVCREDFGRASSWSFTSPRENRYWFMSGLRLRHCCEHAAVNALAPGKEGPFEAMLHGGDSCVKAIEKLLLVDALAARLHCEFEEVLARYDCGQSYSVIHNCTHCKEAYRKWVCSSLVPYFAHGGPLDLEPSKESWIGRRLRPCRSLCQSVEQRCPYLLPGDRAPAYPTQYAGEPTFLCRDPNIPETGEQATRALHPNTEDECCFKICSEEQPALGICANCTGQVPYMGPKYRNPPIAPQCDIITSLSGQQQLLPARRQLSLCGSGGIGSMITNDNSFFIDPPTSSVFSESSTESSLPIITNNTSSSSAAIMTSSPIPFLCLFWLWSILFYSQCSVRRLFGVTSLAEYYHQVLCAFYTRIIQLFFIELLPTICYYFSGHYFYGPGHPRRCKHLTLPLNTSLKFTVSSISIMTNDIFITERYLYKGDQSCRCYCYRWWLWPSRWKSYFIFLRLSSDKFCSMKGHYCRWCYWCWLWPFRWKRKKFINSLNKGHYCSSLVLFRRRQQILKPRKKRRHKVCFSTLCCRELNFTRSTS